MLRPASVSKAAVSLSRSTGGVVHDRPGPGRQTLPTRGQRSLAVAPRAATGKESSERIPQPELYIGLSNMAEDSTPSCLGGTSLSSSCSSTTAPAAAVLTAAAVLLCLPAPAEALSLQEAVGGLEDLIQSSGILGPVIFIAAYVAATVLLVPASLLTLAAGFLFGPILGTAVVSLAATAGAAAAFLVGRYLARPAVEKRIQGNPRFAAVDAAIGRQGAKIVLLLRLSPLFPFNLLNYALSLTKIEFLPYVLASWAGMLPGTVAYVALGGAGKAAAETAAGSGAGPLQLLLYALGAGATLWATAIISKAASKALEEASAADAASGSTEAAPLQQDTE